MKNLATLKLVLLAVLTMVLTTKTNAQNSSEAIAQKLQNPLANLSALPIQHNFGFGASQNNAMGYGLNFQPIHSTSKKNINIIHRGVIGVGYVPGITGGLAMLPQGAPEDGDVSGTWGITDVNYSALFAPKKTKSVAWGLGPSVNLPIASDNRLGTGKWSGGFSGVLVYQTKKWTFDIVARQTWSFAGDANRRDVNQTVIQPLVAYSLGKGWIVNTFPTINVNWDFENGQKWTVPVGGGLSKVLMVGKTPMALGAQYYSYAVRPDLAPKSEFRISTTIVFSK